MNRLINDYLQYLNEDIEQESLLTKIGGYSSKIKADKVKKILKIKPNVVTSPGPVKSTKIGMKIKAKRMKKPIKIVPKSKNLNHDIDWYSPENAWNQAIIKKPFKNG